MKHFLLLLTLLLSLSATAQEPEKKEGKAFRGYYNITDVGLLVGSPQNRHPAPFSFMTVNGWHLTEQLGLGLGVGVEFPAGSYLPVVLDARYYVRQTGFSPFFSLSGGYSIALDDDGQLPYGNAYYDAFWPYPKEKPYVAKGGWLINPGFGIRNMFGENFGVVFGVGYRFQRLHYESDLRRMLVDYNRLTLKIGIIFR